MQMTSYSLETAPTPSQLKTSVCYMIKDCKIDPNLYLTPMKHVYLYLDKIEVVWTHIDKKLSFSSMEQILFRQKMIHFCISFVVKNLLAFFLTVSVKLSLF